MLLTACASKTDKPNLPCKGPKCQSTQLLDNSASKKEWYCYGKESGGSWRCGNIEDDSQIVALSLPDQTTHRPKATLIAPIQETREELPVVQRISAQLSPEAASQTKPINEQRLSGQPREHYTIQIMALTDKTKLSIFAQENNIEPALIVHTVSRGSRWYVLLLGTYPNYTAAKEARLKWHQDNPKQKEPWIRELGPLQDSLVEEIGEDLT
ncbi:MAG: septal ring-binding cell division protein DamX [Candidatus Azotimanducaceae bacterium]|jgi:septal ring-binding cell division protein DamX